MPKPALEALPYDLIVEVLHTLSDFYDLKSLITTSSVFYKLFNVYSHSILTRVAMNIIGQDAWKDATTVLVYQRKANSGVAGRNLPDYAALSFTLQEEDIHNLIVNQQFFTRCAAGFETCTSTSRVPSALALGSDENRGLVLLSSISIGPFLDAFSPSEKLGTLSFAAGDTLPAGFFYQAFLLSIQIGYDTIEMFARRPPMSAQQVTDLHFLSHVILLAPDYEDYLLKPLWDRTSGDIKGDNFFSEFVYELPCRNFVLDTNHLLLHKVICHLKNMDSTGGVFGRYGEYRPALDKFLGEYRSDPVKATLDYAGKYDLSCGWDKTREHEGLLLRK